MTPKASPVPQGALLQRYVEQGPTYTDCFSALIPQQISLDQFVKAFYTTPLFRAERLVLSVAMRKRIRDSDISEMLAGETDTFAAWTVEARAENELLMCDLSSITRSWLAIQPEAQGTRLYFGSAVVTKSGQSLPKVIRLTQNLHVLYSKALLQAAVRRSLRQ